MGGSRIRIDAGCPQLTLVAPAKLVGQADWSEGAYQMKYGSNRAEKIAGDIRKYVGALRIPL